MVRILWPIYRIILIREYSLKQTNAVMMGKIE
jgi:hypothetical protein